MKLTRLAVAGMAVLLGTACDEYDNTPTTAPTVPIAFTRFVHAVPDTMATDWRFIDQLENSPTEIGLAYRGFSPYQATATGARKLRIFPAGTDINVVSKFFVDTTLTFEANTYYTIIHFGMSRAGQSPADRVIVLQDNIPSPGTNIAVRAVNLSAGNVDVFSTATATATLPASAMFANVAPGAASAYSTTAPAAFALRVTNSGTTTPVQASLLAPAGEAANPTQNLTTIGGSTQPGSVITALYFPRSVSGSTAPQTTAFQSPAVVYLIDRHPK